VLFPTEWDQRQIAACSSIADGFEVEFGVPTDAGCRWDLDIIAHIEQESDRHAGRISGVMSSSDYPGAIAAAVIAERLGLRGPKASSVLLASHKYMSRVAQARATPHAVPGFALVDPHQFIPPEIGFPCFVKPVKGSFSHYARRVDDVRELETFVCRAEVKEYLEQYLFMFERLLRRYADSPIGCRHFIAEQILSGEQITVEGFVWRGEVTVLGVVDTVFHESGSFLRFDYPSRLPEQVQAGLRDIASGAVLALGLDDTMFNVEMMYDPTLNKMSIVEVNPRMAGQFADLYEKVDGVNGYHVALALACGERPVVRHGSGRFRAAASFPFRVYEPTRVVNAPRPERVREVERAHPGALIWVEYATGDELTDLAGEDGRSLRYAVFNLGGDDHDDLEETKRRIHSELEIELAAI
jgi:biotin carboxylase